MFVVILTEAAAAVYAAPRAVGPFASYDSAQAFTNVLVEQWTTEEGDAAPTATIVRVEEPRPGVVVGEL